MKVLLEFKNSHHYWEEYEKCSLYCPNCGKQEVWEEQGGGDYYEGNEHVCVSCDFMFTMPGGSVRKDEWSQIAPQLRSGVANIPKTRRGN